MTKSQLAVGNLRLDNITHIVVIWVSDKTSEEERPSAPINGIVFVLDGLWEKKGYQITNSETNHVMRYSP
jgi:hypothetical protein